MKEEQYFAERLQIERENLAQRIIRLQNAMAQNDRVKLLDKFLISQQLKAMQQYLEILDVRISLY